MITKWNYQPLTTQQESQATEVSAACGDNRVISELLVRRGVTTPHEAEKRMLPPDRKSTRLNSSHRL